MSAEAPKVQDADVRRAARSRLQPEGNWMGRAYSLNRIFDGLNSRLDNGDIDGFLRLNKLAVHRITSYWLPIAKFFIMAKTPWYLIEPRILYSSYSYRDRDGKVDLSCMTARSTDRQAGSKFMRRVITDDGLQEDNCRIKTWVEEGGQLYNPETWLVMDIEQRCTIPPDSYGFFIGINNYKGGLLQEIVRTPGLKGWDLVTALGIFRGELSPEKLVRIPPPVEGIRVVGAGVYGSGEPNEVHQKGLRDGMYLIPREQFSQYFPPA
ncbi:hypothetical protein HYU45_01390 [Candidatus Daviesbacteria bacterium]|nr:hypothetical protein [Candidatus Daviesbacteria bacterium]